MKSAVLKNQSNIGVALELVLTGRACSRMSIAKETGLSKMTASNLVNSLIKDDVLVENTEEERSPVGRPAAKLSLSPLAPKFIGISLTSKSGKVSLSDLAGNPIKTFQAKWLGNSSEGEIVEAIFQSIDAVLRTSINERICGVSLIAEDPFDPRSGLWAPTPEDRQLSIDIAAQIREKYDLSVFSGKQGQSFAAAEHLFGSAIREENFIYLGLGNEIVTGIFIGGKGLYHLAGGEMSLGHVSIDYNGLSCACGNRGCLQSYVSTEAMEKKLREITKLKTDFKGFCDLQNKKNDPRIDWALKDMMDKIGFVLMSVSRILNPSLIIVGGQGIYLPERYLAKLEKNISIKKGGFGQNALVRKPGLSEKLEDKATASPILQAIFHQELILH